MPNQETFYRSMSELELQKFEQMFSVFQDLILAMIRNAVRVLPKDQNKTTPSITAHLNVNNATKQYHSYDAFIDIKDVFLSCISDRQRRLFFNSSVSHFTLNRQQKVKFCIKRSIFKILDNHSQFSFKEDIKKLEKIINTINDNFNLRLPEAKQQGKLMISKIRRIDIPQKAKYNQKTQQKTTGREKS